MKETIKNLLGPKKSQKDPRKGSDRSLILLVLGIAFIISIYRDVNLSSVIAFFKVVGLILLVILLALAVRKNWLPEIKWVWKTGLFLATLFCLLYTVKFFAESRKTYTVTTTEPATFIIGKNDDVWYNCDNECIRIENSNGNVSYKRHGTMSLAADNPSPRNNKHVTKGETKIYAEEEGVEVKVEVVKIWKVLTSLKEFLEWS